MDIPAKSSAFLPLQEACIYKLMNVAEAGIFRGLMDEFMIIGENEDDDSLVLSLKAIQIELAWERCRQLQADDVVVKGKVRNVALVLLCFSLFFYCFYAHPKNLIRVKLIASSALFYDH